jgi:hypothetical protein
MGFNPSTERKKRKKNERRKKEMKGGRGERRERKKEREREERERKEGRKECYQFCLCCFFFAVVVLEFEVRASHTRGNQSTQSHVYSPFCFSLFLNRTSHICLCKTLTVILLLPLSSHQDYNSVPPQLLVC